MAYCIRCGVKLDDRLVECPLCRTPVIDPDTLRLKKDLQHEEHGDHGFSSREISDMLVHSFEHRLSPRTASIATFFLLVPIFTTILIDILTMNQITWSFYPIISIVYFWIAFILPSMFKGTKRLGFLVNLSISSIIFLVLLDGFLPPVSWAWYPAAGFVLFIAAVTSSAFLGKRVLFPVIITITIAATGVFWFLETITGGTWYLALALPIIALSGVTALLTEGVNALFQKKKSSKAAYYSAGTIIVMAGLYTVGIDTLCTWFIPERNSIGWSLIAAGALTLIALLLFATGISSRLRSFFEKKFYT